MLILVPVGPSPSGPGPCESLSQLEKAGGVVKVSSGVPGLGRMCSLLSSGEQMSFSPPLSHVNSVSLSQNRVVLIFTNHALACGGLHNQLIVVVLRCRGRRRPVSFSCLPHLFFVCPPPACMSVYVCLSMSVCLSSSLSLSWCCDCCSWWLVSQRSLTRSVSLLSRPPPPNTLTSCFPFPVS